MDEELFGEDEFDFLGDDDDDDAGDEELVGDLDPDVAALLSGDDAELIGASPAARMQALARLRANPGNFGALSRVVKKKVAAGLAKKRAAAFKHIALRRAIGVRRRPNQIAGEIPVGFSAAAVAAGASTIIVIQPPVVYKPKRLLVPKSIASTFTLDDVSIGLRKCLLTSNPVPCEAFAEDSINQGWKIPTLQIGQSMSMTFTNQSGAAATLRGAWLGIYVD